MIFQQLKYFNQDVKRMVGKQKFRILYICFSRGFWGISLYRFERVGLALYGRYYSYIRVIFLPLFNVIQAYSNLDINYKADIKGGMLILHPSVGVVISGYAKIGINLTLTGGNIIGAKKGARKLGDIRIGNNCELGANAVIIGPIALGNQIQIGASACVVNSYEGDNFLLVGVPAKPITKTNQFTPLPKTGN